MNRDSMLAEPAKDRNTKEVEAESRNRTGRDVQRDEIGQCAYGHWRIQCVTLARGKEDGIAIGKVMGEAIGEARIIISMYKKGFTVEQIANATDKDEADIKAVIEGKEPVLA